ncbi:MAG: acetyl-CoA carboxylase biotin carboxyl carrier protein subunit [Chloroflexi bacterium]|nr:acetyl-CoA carboxylase biotin carboxyl carrier protein subunit [Chloroflexota bacterium]
MAKTLKVKVRDRWFTVEVGDLTGNPVRVLVDGDPVDVDLEGLTAREEKPSLPAPQPAEASTASGRKANPNAPTPPPTPTATPAATKMFRSPMPGVILSVSVKIGDQVVTGDEVCVLEAMKMQQVLRADWTGVVRAIHVEPGQQVSDGDPIVELE